MIKLKQILIEHKLAVIFAILMSLIIAFPQFYFRIDQKEIYQGIELLPGSPWPPRAREVQDGHLNWGSIYYKDGKDLPYLFQPFGSAVVAYMGSIFSLNINNTLLLSALILPFLVFLLIYCFVLLLSRDKLMAVCSAVVILLAGPILYIPGLNRLLQGISPGPFLELAGPVNPAMIYILFFGFLASFWLFYQRRNWQWGMTSAIVLGLNFYNYFYTWTYLYAFGGLLVLIFLFQKKWQEAIKISYVFIGGLLVAIPYAINLYRVTMHPVYAETSIRLGVVATHAPSSVGFVIIGALVLFFLGFPREDREKYYFSLALLLAPFITMNQQLLTGKAMQAAHYHWYFHKPIAVIFVIWVIFHFLSRRNLNFYKKVFATIIITVSLYAGIFTQIFSYLHNSEHGLIASIERQKYGPVMKWLSENAPKESVVFANNKVSDLIVIYTPLNVFHHIKGPLSLATPEERVRNALFTYYRLQDIGKDDAREVFHQEERVRLSTILYGIYYRQYLGSYDAIPDEKINEIIAFYEEALKTPTAEWLRDIWKKYEVEYLVWDKATEPSWQLTKYPFLVEEVVFGDLAIYHFMQ